MGGTNVTLDAQFSSPTSTVWQTSGALLKRGAELHATDTPQGAAATTALFAFLNSLSALAVSPPSPTCFTVAEPDDLTDAPARECSAGGTSALLVQTRPLGPPSPLRAATSGSSFTAIAVQDVSERQGAIFLVPETTPRESNAALEQEENVLRALAEAARNGDGPSRALVSFMSLVVAQPVRQLVLRVSVGVGVNSFVRVRFAHLPLGTLPLQHAALGAVALAKQAAHVRRAFGSDSGSDSGLDSSSRSSSKSRSKSGSKLGAVLHALSEPLVSPRAFWSWTLQFLNILQLAAASRALQHVVLEAETSVVVVFRTEWNDEPATVATLPVLHLAGLGGATVPAVFGTIELAGLWGVQRAHASLTGRTAMAGFAAAIAPALNAYCASVPANSSHFYWARTLKELLARASFSSGFTDDVLRALIEKGSQALTASFHLLPVGSVRPALRPDVQVQQKMENAEKERERFNERNGKKKKEIEIQTEIQRAKAAKEAKERARQFADERAKNVVAAIQKMKEDAQLRIQKRNTERKNSTGSKDTLKEEKQKDSASFKKSESERSKESELSGRKGQKGQEKQEQKQEQKQRETLGAAEAHAARKNWGTALVVASRALEQLKSERELQSAWREHASFMSSLLQFVRGLSTTPPSENTCTTSSRVKSGAFGTVSRVCADRPRPDGTCDCFAVKMGTRESLQLDEVRTHEALTMFLESRHSWASSFFTRYVTILPAVDTTTRARQRNLLLIEEYERAPPLSFVSAAEAFRSPHGAAAWRVFNLHVLATLAEVKRILPNFSHNDVHTTNVLSRARPVGSQQRVFTSLSGTSLAAPADCPFQAVLIDLGQVTSSIAEINTKAGRELYGDPSPFLDVVRWAAEPYSACQENAVELTPWRREWCAFIERHVPLEVRVRPFDKFCERVSSKSAIRARTHAHIAHMLDDAYFAPLTVLRAPREIERDEKKRQKQQKEQKEQKEKDTERERRKKETGEDWGFHTLFGAAYAFVFGKSSQDSPQDSEK